MNSPAANHDTIVNYLLGSLPEAETERLDELSIADDEFAVALDSAEKDLIDAYLQGELRGPALEGFRTYYLASPLRRGRLDFARTLRTVSEKQPNLTREQELQKELEQQRQAVARTEQELARLREERERLEAE